MGKFPARGYTYSLPEEKTEKKKRKTKHEKQAILEVFVEFPAISILFYHVALVEWLLNVIIFVTKKF